MEAVWWVLDVLRRHRLFANLKKCRFHKDKVCFLGYVVSAQEVRIEDEQIEVVKNWYESMLVRDIQVFISFANFYQRFIRGFSKIAAPLTSMLKTTKLSDNLATKLFRAVAMRLLGIMVVESIKRSRIHLSPKNLKTRSPEILTYA